MSESSRRFDTAKKSNGTSKLSVLDEINSLVGMPNIKAELNKLMAFAELIQLRRERDIPMEKMGLHMVFAGPPGTGKTILARKFGEMFKSIGLLREGRVVEVDRSSLIGDHMGDTEKLMRDAFERAKNGVLFIDEAYSLAGISAEGITHDTSDSYSKAAVDTLMKLMEDNRSSVVVIVAGYKEPMDRFLRRNVGLKSRFPKVLEFLPYDYDELLEIFKSMAADWKYVVGSDAEDEAKRFIRTWPIKDKDFGNAREVRTFFEAILPVQAERIAALPNFKSLPNDDLLTIKAEDVTLAVKTYEKGI